MATKQNKSELGENQNVIAKVDVAEYLNRVTFLAPRWSEMFDLSGKVAVVVGGNKGIGQAIALAFAGAGAHVCVVGRGPDGLMETAEAITSLGRTGNWLALDVTIEDNVIELKKQILEMFGTLDILVNSQGAAHLQEIAKFDTSKWDNVMSVNLRSVFLCCKHLGSIMLEKGAGKIINIASVRGFQGRAKDAAYAPSKAALIQLTRSLAIEWGVQGVNVNAIAPTFTLTPLSEKFFEDKPFREFAISRIPMKRLGKVEDIMGPALFLVSKASDFVNGNTLPVDGGWLSA